MLDVIAHFNESQKSLTPYEARMLIKSFSNADVSQIKSLDSNVIKLATQKNFCDQHFHCVTHKKIIELYNAATKKYLQDIVEELAEELCSNPKYECIEYYSIEAKYNCIGFAIGVIGWIEPYHINRHVKKGLSPTQAIDSFIAEQRVAYSADHPANLFQLLDNFQSAIDQAVIPTNNTVAFYFKDGECQHAARYIADFNAWVSKLGEWIPITHPTLDDLTGNAYGNATCYIQLNEVCYHTDL